MEKKIITGDEPVYADPMRGAEQSLHNQEPNGLPTGLTKREHFAAMALQGMLSAYLSGEYFHLTEEAESRCNDAVMWADSLIAALNK